MKLGTEFMHTFAAEALSNPVDKDNVTVSPVCVMFATVAVALAATKNSETHVETCAVLGMDMHNEEPYLEQCKKIREEVTENCGNVKVSMALSMWCDNVKPDFTERCKDRLAAQVRGLVGYEFINAWAKENTGGMITEVLTKDPEPPLYLMPVVSFTGTWTNMFEDYQDKEFRWSETEKMPCKMMHLNAKLMYTEFAGVEIVELPYGVGLCVPVKAYVLLPVEDTLSVDCCLDLIADTAHWKGVKNSLEEAYMFLTMPPFKVEGSTSLNGTLGDLGMATAFGGNSSFTRLSDNPDVFLKNIQHVVKIEVNKEGTTAAAATPVQFATRGKRVGPKSIEMQVVRPFVFMITCGESILFASAIRKPVQ
jgi:serpin B